MRLIRPVVCLALAGLAASGSFALAADAPKSSVTSKTLYMAQEGCGTTAEAGRLEIKPQADGADGCGTIGGIPINELAGSADDYTSNATLKPFKLDVTKKVKGQVAAGSWFGGGGAGEVAFDVALIGTTTLGKSVDFGTTTVTASVAGAAEFVEIPFELSVPASAKGVTMKSFNISVLQRGMNVGMSAKKLSGSSYVVIPAKK